MKKAKVEKKGVGVSEKLSTKDQDTFDEIQHMFESSYVEPDQNVLELHPSQASKKARRTASAIDSTTLTASQIEGLIQKHINDWMYDNAPQIIRKILNKKIDELKK